MRQVIGSTDIMPFATHEVKNELVWAFLVISVHSLLFRQQSILQASVTFDLTSAVISSS